MLKKILMLAPLVKPVSARREYIDRSYDDRERFIRTFRLDIQLKYNLSPLLYIIMHKKYTADSK